MSESRGLEQPRPFLSPLFTEVPGSRILRTSHCINSQKFASSIMHSPGPMLGALRRAHSAYKARIMVAQDVRELMERRRTSLT
jgi:hypothetical protein